MRVSYATLKSVISEAMLSEFGGKIRKTKGGGQQYKIGKVEDENRELSYNEAEHLFPGSTEAWIDIVTMGDDFPDLKGMDPTGVKRNTLWFKIGNELRVAMNPYPQIELMRWDAEKQDFFDLGPGQEDAAAE